MQIPKPKIDELVNEMNEKSIFKNPRRTRKNIERKRHQKKKG